MFWHVRTCQNKSAAANTPCSVVADRQDLFVHTIYPEGRRTRPRVSTIDAAMKMMAEGPSRRSTGGDH
jgi:hypothetical protein